MRTSPTDQWAIAPCPQILPFRSSTKTDKLSSSDNRRHTFRQKFSSSIVFSAFFVAIKSSALKKFEISDSVSRSYLFKVTSINLRQNDLDSQSNNFSNFKQRYFVKRPVDKIQSVESFPYRLAEEQIPGIVSVGSYNSFATVVCLESQPDLFGVNFYFVKKLGIFNVS